jgi:transcriptional regulator with XRE-family HTH domain
MNTIRALRDLRDLTQAELAEAAGTSQPAIAAYEAGRKSPTLRTVERLAEAAGLEATVTFHPPMTREDRRSLHLHRAIARGLEREPEAARARVPGVGGPARPSAAGSGFCFDRPEPPGPRATPCDAVCGRAFGF